LIGLSKLGVSGGTVAHGPTVTDLEFSVKVMRHKAKINFCGKRWSGVVRERCVGVGVRGGGFGDSRNGNGS